VYAGRGTSRRSVALRFTLERQARSRSEGGRSVTDVVVNHSDQQWRESRPGSRLQLIADPTGSVSGLALLNQECRPGVGAPSHTHEFEEVLTIVSGTAEVWVDDRHYTAGPGTTVFVRTGAVHGFTNVGDELLQLRAVIAATELRATYLRPEGDL
jgi:mannose-6-phosphate isomerase-like protein (cupin superfamily)